MAHFQAAPEILAFLLDLPDGAVLGRIERVPVGNGQSVYQIEVTGGGFPDTGVIALEYQETDDGGCKLLGFSELEPSAD